MRCVATIALSAVAVVAAPGKKSTQKALRTGARAGLMGMLGVSAAWDPKAIEAQNKLTQMLDNPQVMQDEFHTFADQYGRDYVSATSNGPAVGQESVYAQKFQTFQDNVRRSADLTMEADGEAWFGVNKFADLSAEEFKESHLSCLHVPAEGPDFSGMSEYKPEGGFLSRNDYSKDWRDEGVISDVKDQGQCGSCWAFSTVETLESSVTQQFGEKWVGSPQQLVSCDHKGDMGCGGGLPLNAYKYLANTPLDSESDYPYKSGDTTRSGKCHAHSKEKGKYEVDESSIVSSDPSEEGKMKEFIGTKGPLSIAVDATVWQAYQGGVLSKHSCHAQRLDHAVQLVALDDAKGVWTVRNSWASDWGEEGYIRLKAGTNTCMIAEMATTASAKKYDGGEAEIEV